MSKFKKTNPWAWILPLYFLEGLPNAIVAFSAILFYSAMGLTDGQCVELTSALYLPWLLKPLWSPFIDNIFTKRKWALFCALAISVLFFALAATADAVSYASLESDFLESIQNYAVHITAFLFFMLAITSATFDISSDGFYMLALDSKSQAFFVGIRSAAYRIAMVFAQGAVLYFAGYFGRVLNSQMRGWCVAYGICGVISTALFLYFLKFLPKPESDAHKSFDNVKKQLVEFFLSFKEYFFRPHIFCALAYILFYRFAEAQLGKILPLFLKGNKINGGLEIDVEQIGIIYGANAPIAGLIGGILGGILISKFGLKKWIIPMAISLNLPNLLYLMLAVFSLDKLWLIAGCVFVEQFGYGFGFAAYLMFLIQFSEGERKTSFYAISTGLMSLGLMFPGFICAWVKEKLNYTDFFYYIMLCCIVSLAVSFLIKKYVKD